MIYRRRCTARWRIYWSINVYKKPLKPLYSNGGWTIYDFSNEEYFALEAMIRKKAVGPRTKLTLSDIFHL